MVELLRVTGNSLLPRYREGDFVLVSKIPFLFGRVRPGDVIAFRHPDHGTMIKQVEAVAPGGDAYIVVGTHPHSVDSRQIGPVKERDLIGRVLVHIRKPVQQFSF